MAARVLVVIPTVNEATNLAEVLGRVRAALPEGDVLVVDGASTDGTPERAEELGAELGRIRVLRQTERNGIGGAYRAAFRAALAEGYDVVIEMDADLSHPPEVLPQLAAAAEAGARLAIGSRYVPGGSTPGWPWLRRAISRGGNAYVRLILGMSTRDATAGFRAYRALTLEQIAFDATRADGYAFQVEMAYRVHRTGGGIVELPIEFHDRERGSSKMSSRIVAEAMALVTKWAVRDRILRRA